MTDNSRNKNPGAKQNVKFLVMAGVFFLLAVSFAFDLWGDLKTIKENPLVDSQYLTTDTVREPHNAPKIVSDGETYYCDDCHQYIEPSLGTRSVVEDHEDIKLNHGINDRCYNCHHRTKRETLVDIYGNEIPFEHNELLCQKCHGPKYRDWVAGVHGRPNGYWDDTKGESVKARCASCHDPHDPKFKPLKPLPPPVLNNYNSGEGQKHGTSEKPIAH